MSIFFTLIYIISMSIATFFVYKTYNIMSRRLNSNFQEIIFLKQQVSQLEAKIAKYDNRFENYDENVKFYNHVKKYFDDKRGLPTITSSEFIVD